MNDVATALYLILVSQLADDSQLGTFGLCELVAHAHAVLIFWTATIWQGSLPPRGMQVILHECLCIAINGSVRGSLW